MIKSDGRSDSLSTGCQRFLPLLGSICLSVLNKFESGSDLPPGAVRTIEWKVFSSWDSQADQQMVFKGIHFKWFIIDDDSPVSLLFAEEVYMPRGRKRKWPCFQICSFTSPGSLGFMYALVPQKDLATLTALPMSMQNEWFYLTVVGSLCSISELFLSMIPSSPHCARRMWR